MKEPIQVERSVTVNGVPTPVQALPKARQAALARWLKVTYLNELCRGKAVVSPQTEGNGKNR